MNKKRMAVIGIAAVVAIIIIKGTTSNTNSSVASTIGVTQGAQPISNDNWRVAESRSAMDDSEGMLLSLNSEDVIQGPTGAARPSLNIRCKEGKTDIYVVTGMAADIEDDPDGEPSDTHTVRTRLDDAPAQTEPWFESTDHTALFGGGQELAKALSQASTYTFQFTPFDGSPQTFRFDVRGLDAHLHKLADACGWGYE
jgi:hypothetical protein